jgi:DNA-binding cell septation regulator SpoVG
VDCVLNGALKLSGLALRRTRKGDLRLSFPVKRNSSGQEHYIVRPIHDAARQELERRIIEALGHGGRQP